MLLSIIIPSFQQGTILQRALKSIEQQTFKDYEVLIMDGGSSDETSEVVAKFNHLPIVFASEADSGIYDAMNKGVNLSTGKFLYFMGCDDKLASPTVLETVFNDKKNLNTDFIYGDVIFTKDNNIYDGKFGRLKLMSKNICHQGIFTQRKVFNVIGGFDQKYKYLADWVFNMQCFASNWIKKRYIPVIIAHYNNDGSSFNNPDDNFLLDKATLEDKYFPSFLKYLNRRRGRLYDKLLPYL